VQGTSRYAGRTPDRGPCATDENQESLTKEVGGVNYEAGLTGGSPASSSAKGKSNHSSSTTGKTVMDFMHSEYSNCIQYINDHLPSNIS